MRRRSLFSLLVVSALVAADSDFVFRSDVSLVRVDAQVVDRNNRTLTGLTEADFIVRENGVPQTISHFGSEETPMDVVLLLDVSGSMRPHVERVAYASRTALMALGRDDRIGIMVFDRASRVRMPLRSSRADTMRELDLLLRHETFNGGTDITRALYDAAEYLGREARPQARRAIVILTDDETERNRDVRGVGQALSRHGIVMSALLAPHSQRGGAAVGWPPLGGGGMGGIILGPRRRHPGPIAIPASRNSSAGTAQIAKESGGDSFKVNDAEALENTLLRLRQRYALHFKLPEGVHPGQERNIEVELTEEALRRHRGARVYARRMQQQEATSGQAQAASARSTVPEAVEPETRADLSLEPEAQRSRTTGGWRRVDEPAPAEAPAAAVEDEAQTDPPPGQSGGWRRAQPDQQQP